MVVMLVEILKRIISRFVFQGEGVFYIKRELVVVKNKSIKTMAKQGDGWMGEGKNGGAADNYMLIYRLSNNSISSFLFFG